MSGGSVTFLFPDHTTALTGTFSKSEMLLGQVSFIQVSGIGERVGRNMYRDRLKGVGQVG